MLLVGEREHHLCGLLILQGNGSVWGCEWFHCLIQVLSSGIRSRVPAWGQHMPVCVGWDGWLSRWMEMIDMRQLDSRGRFYVRCVVDRALVPRAGSFHPAMAAHFMIYPAILLY